MKPSKPYLWILFYLPVLWLAVKLAALYQPGLSIFDYMDLLPALFSHPFQISINSYTLTFVAVFTLAFGVAVSAYYVSEGKRRIGEEHGSAVWGNVKMITRKYGQDRYSDILLTDKGRLGLNTYKHQRNLNVLVIGGSGSGKTRFYAKPNIMQCNTSFVITDPKSELLKSTGNLLKREGYDIKVLNLIDFAASDGYNPFRYIRDEKDVLKLISNLMANTTPKGSFTNEPFWEKSEMALLQALMFYLLSEAPESEQNFGMVMTMLSFAGASEADETFESALDMLFSAFEHENPEHLAVKQYKIYKQAAGKTAKSILISLAVRLAAFNLQQIQNITTDDQMDIACLGQRKTALFAVIPDNDTSFNYLVGMLYTQIFTELYYQADHVYDGRLPLPVHFIMDEFPNVALPDSFDKCLSTMRSRNISASIIIQNLAQLKGLFKTSLNAWETITGNCDTLLYLGGNEQSTHEYISKLLGKATIQTQTFGHTRGRSGSYSTNQQITGRELLTPDEVRMIDNQNALLFIRGERPVCDKKFNLMKHRNLAKTTDIGKVPYTHHIGEDHTTPLTERIDLENAEDYIILN